MSEAPYKWNKYTSKSTVTYKWDKCYPYKRTLSSGSGITERFSVSSSYDFDVYVFNSEPTPINAGTLVIPSYEYRQRNGTNLRYDYDLRENYWYCEEVGYGLNYLTGKWYVYVSTSKYCGRFVRCTYPGTDYVEFVIDRVTIDSGKKGDRIQTVFSEVSTAYPDNAISSSDGYWYTKTGSSTDYSQGDFVGTVSSDNPDAYPKNGRHKDGYWYVLI